jgi:hypothetical protein
MNLALIDSNLVHHAAARRRVGLLEATRRLLAHMNANLHQAALRSEVKRARRDAAELRRMAHRFRQWNPGFAADLDAAADRHEIESGVCL